MLDQIFFLTVLLVFVGVLTSIWLQRRRDDCLASFEGCVVSMEFAEGVIESGRLRVVHNGLELLFDSPVPDEGGENFEKTSLLVFEPEIKTIRKILRMTHLLDEKAFRARQERVKRSWHPSTLQRTIRKGRNLLNLMADAFHQSLSLFLGRLKQGKGTGIVAQQDKLEKIGGSMITMASNSYEPLLEPWIGHRIVVEGSDSGSESIIGVLKDYTSTWIELLDAKIIDTFILDTQENAQSNGVNFSLVSEAAPHGSTPDHSIIRLFNSNPWAVRVISIESGDYEKVLEKKFEPTSEITFEMSSLFPDGAVDSSSSFQVHLEACQEADLCIPRSQFTVRHGAEPLT